MPVPSSGLRIHCAAAALTGLSAGDPVSTFTNLVSGGTSVTASGAGRPLYHTASGVPALHFDGTRELFLGTHAYDSANGFTLVFRVKLATGGFIVGDLLQLSPGTPYAVFSENNGLNLNAIGVFTGNAYRTTQSIDTSTWRVVTVSMPAGGTSQVPEVRVDGTIPPNDGQNVTHPAADWVNSRLGGYNTPNGIFLLRDFLVYDGPSDATKVAAIIAGLDDAGGGGGGPTVDSVSDTTPDQGSALTITGTNFGATQGTGGVTFTSDGVTTAAAVTSWSATSIVVTVPPLKWGVTATLTVTIDGGTSATPFALGVIPALAGWDYMNIATPNATASNRLTSTADIATTDQVRYQTIGGKVIVYDDATFSDDGTVTAFNFNVWKTGDGQGTAATQTISSYISRRRARLGLSSAPISATSRVVSNGAFTGSRTETAAATDSSTAALVSDASRTESVAATDTSTATGSATSDRTETAALTDTQDGVVSATGARTESVTITESSSAVLDASQSVTESTGAQDASTATLDAAASRTESAAISDASDGSVSGGTINASATESVAIADSSTASASATADRSESVAATESSSQTTAATASTTEVMVPTETSSQTTAASVSRTESVAVSDSSTVTQVTMSADRVESAAATELSTASAAGEYSVVTVETVSATDASTASAAASATRTESAAVADASTGSTASNASAADSFTIDEVATANTDRQAATSESAAATESSTTTLSGGAYSASGVESVFIADVSAVVTFAANAEVNEVSPIADAASGLRSVFLDHTEAGVLTATAQAQLFTVINRPARAIVTLSQRSATIRLLTRKATITLN